MKTLKKKVSKLLFGSALFLGAGAWVWAECWATPACECALEAEISAAADLEGYDRDLEEAQRANLEAYDNSAHTQADLEAYNWNNFVAQQNHDLQVASRNSRLQTEVTACYLFNSTS